MSNPTKDIFNQPGEEQSQDPYVHSWKAAWKKAFNYPEETVSTIQEKIHLIFNYTDDFKEAPNIDLAYEHGRKLEYKHELYELKESKTRKLFSLKKFYEDSPFYRNEALELIKEIKKYYSFPEEPIIGAKSENLVSGEFLDSRDKQVYRTVKIGDKTWMAQNLNFNVGDGCEYFQEGSGYAKKHGLLYTWDAAQNACPEGWRLPFDEEWEELFKWFGISFDWNIIDNPHNYNEEGDLIINPLNYNEEGYQAMINKGINGFGIDFGGYKANGLFLNQNDNGCYWSSENNPLTAWSYTFGRRKGEEIIREVVPKSNGYSCRLIKK